MLSSRITSMLVFLALTVCATAQVADQENITVLPFKNWSGSTSSEAQQFQDALTDKMVTRIIQSHRFNVIDRTNLGRLLAEQDLTMTGLIDESTVVKIGGLIGVNKFIMGTFTRSSSEYKRGRTDELGNLLTDPYYLAEIQASIKLLDVHTGRYLEATEAGGKGVSSERRSALLDALDVLADSIITSFEQYFTIQAFITSLDGAEANLDRGTSFGVKTGMNFKVWNVRPSPDSDYEQINFDATTRDIGLLRIVAAEANSARGRFIGAYDEVQSGYLVRETKGEIKLQAQILEKKMKQVTLNVGRNMGVKPGATFRVITKGKDLVDPVTGEIYGQKTKSIGVIYITDSEERFSRGKIVDGFYSVKQGMQVKQEKIVTTNVGLWVSFAPLLPSFASNDLSGAYTIDAQYTGTHEVDLDYTAFDEITSGNNLEIGVYARSLASGIMLGFTYDRYQYSEMLRAWAISGFAGYSMDLIPEFVFLSTSVSVGYGDATQKIPDNLVPIISNDESSVLFASAIPIGANVGVNAKFGKIVLSANGSYRLWNISEWSYWVKNTDDSSGDSDREIVSMQSAYVLYPEVNLGGLILKFGLAIEL